MPPKKADAEPDGTARRAKGNRQAAKQDGAPNPSRRSSRKRPDSEAETLAEQQPDTKPAKKTKAAPKSAPKTKGGAKRKSNADENEDVSDRESSQTDISQAKMDESARQKQSRATRRIGAPKLPELPDPTNGGEGSSKAAQNDIITPAKRLKNHAGVQDDTGMFDAGQFDSPRDEGYLASAEDTPVKLKKRATPAQKRGAARPSGSEAVDEQPGDPNKPKSFISPEQVEQKLAAYLGFNDVYHLHMVALSWPVVKATLHYEPISLNMNKTTAFRLLHDSEALYKDVDYVKKWPLDPKAPAATVLQVKHRHLASILLRLESDLYCMKEDLTDDENTKLQSKYIKDFSTFNKGQRLVPLIKFGGTEKPSLTQHPTLSYERESRMEAINRCWSILRYFKHCQSAQGTWEKRFSAEKLCISTTVNRSYVPAWMLPPKITSRPDAVVKTTEVAAADSLPPLDIQIIWDKDFKFKGKEDLVDALEAAEGDGVEIPDTQQKLLQDPRLTSSLPAFKDAIRRQFNCQPLKVNIRSLSLTYTNATLSAGSVQQINVLTGDWSSTKSTFGDVNNTGFSFRLVLEALDDPENDQIFELFEPPTAVEQFFNTSSGDVESNREAISRIADAAFLHKSVAPEPASEKKEELRVGGLPAFLDLAFGGMGSEDLGANPDPRTKFPNPEDHEAPLAYYDGFDVTKEEPRREWQRRTLMKLTRNCQVAKAKLDKLPKKFTPAQKLAIEKAETHGQLAAMAAEAEEYEAGRTLDPTNEEKRYATMQTTLSGIAARAGPQVDLCCRLLNCVPAPLNRMRPRLLAKITNSDFYPYQISGAVGCILKLYGSMDVEKLLKATDNLDNPRVEDIRAAAAELNDLCIHGAILADEVGLGKTKQALLVGYLHIVLFDGKQKLDPTKDLHQPILLAVPSTLINQWLNELKSSWSCFEVVVSYSEYEDKQVMALNNLTYAAMKGYPNLDALPDHLHYIFDQDDERARRVIVVTSYETHKSRTATKMIRKIPGVPFKKARFDRNGELLWKKKPRMETYWVTNQKGVYSLLIADEAQKVKNVATGLWSVLYLQSFRKTLIATATPMFNSVRDLIALFAILWPMIEIELNAHATPDVQAWLRKVHNGNVGIFKEVEALPKTDVRRYAAFQPAVLRRTVTSATGIHLRVAAVVKVLLDMALIQRSTTGSLPQANGPPISLNGLFKKVIRKTAIVERTPAEEAEYEYWHRAAAMEYINEIALGSTPKPTKPKRADDTMTFISATGPLRKLAIANFSTKMARLNAIMESCDGNTHVQTLNRWRERGYDADFIQDLTRGRGEPKSKTAAELIEYLAEGSPPLRLAFQQILEGNVIERLDKAKYKHHQKILFAEKIPGNAFYLLQALRVLLLDARLMHAGLSNKAKADLVDLFNDPNSTFRIMCMMWEVGIVGLNLHIACDRACGLTLAKNRAQELQFGGRVNRVNQEFDVTVVRRYTPNSHDQFLDARQTDKATVQLAANANDPAIQSLIVQLLNEFQPEVDRVHQSAKGQFLQQKLEQKKKEFEVVKQTRLKEKKRLRTLDATAKAAYKEVPKLKTDKPIVTLNDKRLRKQVERFSDVAFHSTKGYKLSPDELAKVLQEVDLDRCEFCFGEVKAVADTGLCDSCGVVGHWECLGVDPTDEEFTCKPCSNVQEEQAEEHTKSTSGSDEEDERPDTYSARKSAEDEEEDDEEEEGDDETAAAHDEFLEDEASSDDEDEDFDVPTANKSTFGRLQKREDLIEARDELEVIRSSELDDFINETQPDDATRHMMACLSVPRDKVWSVKDLEKEFNLKLGLHLLWMKINGKTELHFSKSIHIRYQSFPKDITDKLTRNLDPTAHQMDAAQAGVA